MTAPSYACGSVDRPLLGETIGQNLRRTAGRFGRHTALVDRTQGVRLTYDELWEQTGRVAGALLARGVRRGDRVGVWAANRWEWVVLQFAAARTGAILVALNPTYEAGELGYALAHSGTSLLLHAARFRDTDCGATVARLRADCPELREAMAFEDGWADLLDGSPAAVDAAEQGIDIDDPVAIQ